jgi:diguanylate cyclase (GGDEF)-like protein
MSNMVRTLREQDSALLGRLALIEKGYLAVVALIAGGALCVQLIPAASHLLPGGWAPGTPQVALALMLSAAALEFTGPRNTAGVKRIGMVLAVVLALLAGAELLRSRSYLPPIPATSPDRQAEAMLSQGQPQPMTALTAAAFLALAAGTFLSFRRKGFPSHAADFSVSVLCLLILLMVRNYLFEGLGNGAAVGRISLLTLLSLALLAFVAFMHRAEVGVFSTLMGQGSGSRIARFAAPVVLLIPFLPRTAVANAVKAGILSSRYLSASIAFLAAGAILTLLLYMAWKINQLEARIRDLALRDDDTGLLNRRGFHMVAWQALRHARREDLAFSVMFIELENLDEVCRAHGMEAGVEMLAEISEVLQAAFRSTDVLGRIDPTQFALAGHFDEKSATIMRLRLHESVNYRNAIPGRSFSFKINVSTVHAKDPKNDTLEDLLARGNESGNGALGRVEPIARAGPQSAS